MAYLLEEKETTKGDTQNEKKCANLSFTVILTFFIAIIMILTIIIAVTLLWKPIVGEITVIDEKGNEIMTNEDKAKSDELTQGDFKIITRDMWKGEPPTEPLDQLKLPVPYVVIWHTATSPCKDFTSCSGVVKLIQNLHMKTRKWWDIGYNFLIGGDGNVYEGRGWQGQGAHTYGFNSKSMGIAFIGTYGTALPSKAQIEACKALLEEGVQMGMIEKDYKLFGATQLSSTSAPGEVLYKEIQTWPHWSQTL